MNLINKIRLFLDKYFFFDRWTCNNCGKEIFDGKFFCDKCESLLPKNNENFCAHCGRKTISKEKYCLSCKGQFTSIDTARSSFTYKEPISFLIQKYKYNGKKYLANLFCDYLYKTAIENKFKPDYIVYVPMTQKSLKKRGFNHGELLAKGVAERLNVEVCDCIIKTKDTKRQAKLNREERLKNLDGAFRLTKRKQFKDKVVMIVDDVLTTGATSETIASKIKSAGAKKILLLTVASVPSKKMI